MLNPSCVGALTLPRARSVRWGESDPPLGVERVMPATGWLAVRLSNHRGRWLSIPVSGAASYPFSPVVEMPSISSRWKTRKMTKTGTSETSDIAISGPQADSPVEAMNKRNP